MPKLRHFIGLNRAEKALFLRALLMLPVVDAELRVRGWRLCHSRLATWAKRRAKSPVPPGIPPERVAWLVERAARNVPWPATCLRRSLVLWALLERAGVATDLRLGFRKTDEVFEAHAWVELNGIPLNDRRDVRTRYQMAGQALAPGDWAET